MADSIFDKIQQTLQRIYDRLGSQKGGGGGQNGNGNTRMQVAQRAFNAVRRVGTAVRGAMSGNFGGVASSLARVGAVAGGVAAGLLGVAAAGVAVVAGFAALVKGTYKLISAQLTQQKELAMFSGALAATFGQSGLQDAMRDKRLADATAASTIELNETFSRLKDSLLDYDIFWTNIKNQFLTTIANGIIPILDGFAEVCRVAAEAWDDFTFEMELAIERIKHFGMKSDRAIIDELRKGREEAKKQAELNRVAIPKNNPAENFLQVVKSGLWDQARERSGPKFF